MKQIFMIVAASVWLGGFQAQELAPGKDIEISVAQGKFVLQNLRISIPSMRASGRVTNGTGEPWRNVVITVRVEGEDPKTKQPTEYKFDLDFKSISERGESISQSVTPSSVLVSFSPRTWDASITAGRSVEYLRSAPKLDTGTDPAFLATDRKCVDQAAQTLAQEGLEPRKKRSDLVTYGCIFSVPRLAPVRVESNDGRYRRVTVLDGEQQGKTGWALATWLK